VSEYSIGKREKKENIEEKGRDKRYRENTSY
jgi:hypothetical protein